MLVAHISLLINVQLRLEMFVINKHQPGVEDTIAQKDPGELARPSWNNTTNETDGEIKFVYHRSKPLFVYLCSFVAQFLLPTDRLQFKNLQLLCFH